MSRVARIAAGGALPVGRAALAVAPALLTRPPWRGTAGVGEARWFHQQRNDPTVARPWVEA
jgi:hypothetical protein